MPSALVLCENGYGYTVVQNCTDIEQTMIATVPFKVDSYEKGNRETKSQLL